MIDFPTLVVPSFDVFSSDWLSQINEEAILAQEEAEYEEKVGFSLPLSLSEVRNANSNLIPIGKTTPENDQEDYEPDAEDDDADNAEEESEGE
ncbi:hypothetical protein MPTK1_6g01740 [Marchantia polymorpha subsp. ruderalis]|uniref:Uncharacterized protein n=2 Tax=Marchantia polymorpha TaxID=3197 RepID=A0AAF6BMI4_MARPO|nr:hypothetical protein MARPO_0052s0030 [Marchantia polymorpha]BBN13218.1 hypothetical protein Mp_6g01740 [Marchantia polymorpha subsp. ruderalis]|eukprot:PTQ38228.1 hypothetical protein MARPO_0052s0030 [Marchantia polymorpha]